MWLVFSAPVGMTFGFTAWALLRGRGGLAGLVFFVLACTVSTFVGSLAAETLGGSQAELLTVVGAAAGGVGAVLALALGLGLEPAPRPPVETLNVTPANDR